MAQKLVIEFGLEGAKAVTVPCVKHTAEEVNRDQQLASAKISHFGGLAARANYL